MQKAYLLIFFTLWCQFDDVLLTPSPSLQSAPLANDDDEYVSVERQKGLKVQPVREKGWLVGLKVNTSDFAIFTGIGAPSVSNLAGVLDPSPLYAFMSLQL